MNAAIEGLRHAGGAAGAGILKQRGKLALGGGVYIRERRAVGMKIGFAGVNGGVFEEAGIELAVAVEIFFVFVEDTIAVDIFAHEHVHGGTRHEAQFIHRFKGGVLGRVTGGGVVQRDDAVRTAPIHDGVGKISGDGGQVLKHVSACVVQVQLAAFIHEAEIRLGRGGAARVAADDPEFRITNGDGGALDLGVVRHGAIGGVIQEGVGNVTGGAFDGLFGGDAVHAVVGRLQLVIHGVGEIKGDADEAEADPEHNDEHGAVLAGAAGAVRVHRCGWQNHVNFRSSWTG